VSDSLTQYAIYERPLDHPEHFVVRAWHGIEGQAVPDPHCEMAKTLAEARRYVPVGYTNIGRMAGDDPAILEVWI
jgi:hypothetical protein